jgi:acyl carrier protein
MSLFERLQSVIGNTLKVPPAQIQPTTTHEDIPAQWDSMGQVNLIMTLEESFGVYIEPEDFERLKSVPAILAYLEAQGAG